MPSEAPPKYARSLRELGEIVGRSHQQLIRYKKAGAPLEKGAKGYVVEELKTWMRESSWVGRKGFEAAAPSEELEGMDFEGLRRELLKAQILEKNAAGELKEIKVKLERGELISLDDVKRRDVERITAVKNGLLALPRRLAQELEGLNANQREVALRDALTDVLRRFSEM